MGSDRQLLNKWQNELRQVMEGFDQPQEALRLFFAQHARLHSAAVCPTESWSYEDEILAGLSAAEFRRVRPGREHSIAWCIWHIARIEDVTLNLLVAGRPQRFMAENWERRLNSPISHIGNAMDEAAVAAFSDCLDIEALRAYRAAVGRATREIVSHLRLEILRQKVDPARLQRLRDEKAVHPDAGGIIDYWSRRTTAGLLLMPATRHSLIHLNEARRLRNN